MNRPIEGVQMADNAMLYTAVYADEESALADLDNFEQLHKDKVIGKYDAAVVDKHDGKPHIVKRVDRPRSRLIPELLGSGELPSNEVKDAAEQLGPDEAALILVGEPTLAEAFDRAVTRAGETAKREFNDATDQLVKDLTGSAET
jgi:hypothetical protein